MLDMRKQKCEVAGQGINKILGLFSDLPLTTSHDHEAVHYIWPHKSNINSEGTIGLPYFLLLLHST